MSTAMHCAFVSVGFIFFNFFLNVVFNVVKSALIKIHPAQFRWE